MKKFLFIILAFIGLFLVSCDINMNNNNSFSPNNKDIPVYSSEVAPTISVESINKINYSIENVCDDLTECSVQILNSDNEIDTVYSSLNGIIRDLNSNSKYKLTGYYYGYINNKLYKVNIAAKEIDTKGFNDVLKIQRSTCVSNIYSNLFVVDTTPFVEAAPEGYNFAGITVTEKDSEEKSIDYTGQKEICVENLKPNTSYLIGSYYDLAPQAKAKMSRSLSGNTPGYRLKFIGFWVVSGDKNANKVEMVYANEVLYTYYVADGDTIFDPYRFVLPEKYNGYYIVGSDKNLDRITSDLVCNLVLAKEEPTTKFVVVFYDFEGNIFHSENVEKNCAAVGPSTTPPNYNNGSILLEFDRWDKDYSNVVSNMSIYPVKKDNTPKDEIPVIEFKNTLISDVYLSGGYKIESGANSIISAKVYLKDSNGSIIDLATDVKGYASYFVEYDSSKTYELHTEIEYKLDGMTESSYIKNMQVINYSNINPLDKKNYSFDAAHDSYKTMHVKVRYDDIDMLVRYRKINEYSSVFYQYPVDDAIANLDQLSPGRTYTLNYAFKDSTDDKLYYVSNQSFEIQTMSKAEFGLEEVKIEYYFNDYRNNDFMLTFVGDKAETVMKNLHVFDFHGSIIENGQEVSQFLNFDTNQITTGLTEDNKKYASIHVSVHFWNSELAEEYDYEYHISQIFVTVGDENFDYSSTSQFEDTEHGVIQYYDIRD